MNSLKLMYRAIHFYWTSRKNNLEVIELSSISKVSLVEVFSRSNTQSNKT